LPNSGKSRKREKKIAQGAAANNENIHDPDRAASVNKHP
jgi:hypothetical protein